LVHAERTAIASAFRERATQHEFTQMIDEARVQAAVAYEKSHVDGAVERIEEQVEIRPLTQFATAA